MKTYKYIAVLLLAAVGATAQDQLTSVQTDMAPVRSRMVTPRVRMVSRPEVTEFRSVDGELLGYTDEPGLNADSLPEALQDWLDGWSEADATPVRFSSMASVSPLLTSTWNQSSPYYYYTPYSTATGTTHCVTGCVATAMAQLMYYHKHPSQGTSSISYQWARAAGDTVTLSQDFSKCTYEWAKMKDKVSLINSDSAAYRRIARLMRDCGYSVKNKYGASSTSAGGTAPASALKTYFDYDNTINIIPHAVISDAEWVSILKQELNASRPVYFTGQTASNIGHAFICDGYNSSGYFHFNWGWGGSSDGYYKIKSLNPKTQGAGGSANDSTGYNWGQSLIIGIQPADASTYSARPIVSADSCPFTRSKVLSINTISGSAYKLYNRGCMKLTNAYVGLFLQDMDGNFIRALDSTTFTLSAGYYLTSAKSVSTTKLTPGSGTVQYRVMLGYRLPNTWHDKSWHTVYGPGGTTFGYDVYLAQQSTPTGVEQVPSDSPTVEKFIRNGRLYLKRNGRLYDAAGQSIGK